MSILREPYRASVYVALFLACFSRPASAGYTIRDLGSLGGPYGSANAVNASGTVTGYSYVNGGDYHAFRYSAGAMADLGALGAAISNGLAIDDAGVVVGAYGEPANPRAFIADANGIRDAGTLGGASTATGVNAGNQVTGWSVGSSGHPHAVIFGTGRTMKDLGTLGTDSFAYAINNAGHIVGDSSLSTGEIRAFLYTAAPMKNLGTLPGGGNSSAVAINNSDQVVGTVEFGNDLHGFLWQNNAMQDLGLERIPQAINDAGVIAGFGRVASGAYHAMVLQGGTWTDLTLLIPANAPWDYLSAAYGINGSGQIVGQGYVNGAARAFLLTPGAPTPLYGDADGDGVVTIADAVAIIKAGAGTGGLANPALCDVSPAVSPFPRGFGDGVIDLGDALRVLRRAQGLEGALP